MSNGDRRRVCVRGIIYRNGKLFCQELKDKDGNGKGFWCTPGGGLDPLEELVEGLKREMLEETGVAADVGRLLFIQQYADSSNFSHDEDEQLEFFFHIKNVDDYEHINENASHFDAEIFNYGFADPKTTNVLPKFLRSIDIEHYINTDCSPYIYAEFPEK